MVIPSPQFTIHIIIVTPGLKTAPEGKSKRRAPPYSSSACLGWTCSLNTPQHQLAARCWLLPGKPRTGKATSGGTMPSHWGVTEGGACELAEFGNTPLYSLTTCFAVPPTPPHPQKTQPIPHKLGMKCHTLSDIRVKVFVVVNAVNKMKCIGF